MLAYPWSEGELLGVSRRERDHPESPFQRFRSLPSETIRKCLGQLFDLHAQLIRAGWIAVDFYDGCLLFDFVGEVLHVIDLDMYRQGAFHNEMGRMFGSSRFMAPEEFELGSAIDELTTVFTMGRTALEFLSDGSLDRNAFRGPEGLYDVAARACEPNRDLRLASMSAFYEGWIRG